MNEFNPAKIKEGLAARLVERFGMEKQEADKVAEKEVESMGATKILAGGCPRGGRDPIACTFCRYGHMTHCHFPHTCEEAKCSHYQEEMEEPDVSPD